MVRLSPPQGRGESEIEDEHNFLAGEIDACVRVVKVSFLWSGVMDGVDVGYKCGIMLLTLGGHGPITVNVFQTVTKRH